MPKPITMRDITANANLYHVINAIENEILVLCDDSLDVTRSDLQGMVSVAAIRIYNRVKSA